MPTTDPTWVRRDCAVARAIPKSVSLIVISPVGGSCAELSRRRRPAGPPITIRLPGLTSRWMIPWRWAYSSPAQAWIPISVVESAPRRPLVCSSWATDLPSTYSMTM